MVALNQLIKKISPSPTLALTAKANQLKSDGEDVIAFTAGEPDLDTPEHVKAAAREAMEKGLTKYTPVGGSPLLKTALIEKFKKDQGLDLEPGNIIVSNGGKQALAEALAVVIEPGDEVIIPAPYWTSYPDMVKLAGGEPVVVMTEVADGYRLTAEKLAQAASNKTKAIILNSPSNPTGACYQDEHLRELADAFLALPNSEDILLLSDEVYEKITFRGFRQKSIVEVAPELFPNTVIVNAFSKTYSMTGWRVGYAAGPSEIIGAMTKYQSQTTSNVCSIAQYAAAHAFNDDYAFPTELAECYAGRFDFVKSELEQMPGLELPMLPEGAFYAFVRCEGLFGKSAAGRTINSASDFASYLLDEFKIVVVPGEAFGDAGAIRLSIAVGDEVLKKGFARLKEAVAAF